MFVGSADEERGGSCGLRAEGSVSKGEPLLSIPFEFCLSAEATRKHPLLGPLVRDFDGWTGAAGLIALRLLHEKAKGTKSEWAPWIEVSFI